MCDLRERPVLVRVPMIVRVMVIVPSTMIVMVIVPITVMMMLVMVMPVMMVRVVRMGVFENSLGRSRHRDMCRGQSRSEHPRNAELVVGAQTTQGLLQSLNRQPCVNERPKDHVARGARERVEIHHPCHSRNIASLTEQYRVSPKIR